MRWLLIALLLSLCGLLATALGMVRHIWVHRSQWARKKAADVAATGSGVEPEP